MEKCLACGGLLVKDGNVEGYIQGSFYDILSCKDCKTKYSNPHTVDTVVYDYIYKNSADTPGYMRYDQYATEVLTKSDPLRWLGTQEHVYYGVIKSLPKKGKILEVGCGLGYFTYALAKHGYDVVGVDVSKEAIDEATVKYGNYFLNKDFFELVVPDDEKYDAILMIELIEHVDNPEKYLLHAKSLLKDGGELIVTTPNRSWYDGVEVLWASDLPPVHLSWFSERGMTLLSSKLGYQVRLVSFAAFNILYGSILGPQKNIGINPPFFTKTGEPLFSKFTHSKVYHLTRKFGVYELLKRAVSIKNKLKEILQVVFLMRQAVVIKSTCMCVVLKK